MTWHQQHHNATEQMKPTHSALSELPERVSVLKWNKPTVSFNLSASALSAWDGPPPSGVGPSQAKQGLGSEIKLYCWFISYRIYWLLYYMYEMCIVQYFSDLIWYNSCICLCNDKRSLRCWYEIKYGFLLQPQTGSTTVHNENTGTWNRWTVAPYISQQYLCS